MYQKEKALTSEQIFDGVVVKLYRDEIELENGERAVREYIRHPGGVCVAAVDDDENIYMVEQFRYPFGKALTEVPAGKLEFGEDPEQCGRRELKEEVGAVADSFEYLGCIYPTVAYDTEIIYMFLARGLHFGEQHLDDGEFLDVKKIPLKEVYRMVMANELNDAKTQMAVLKTYLKLHGEV
ncbi:NUDIX hydrolase [Ruminococcus sp.]|uniref:NUDIX domain-containing protein n=1 Tax=Ruminococcus sp. TaxID=41978 RepID=UPI0025F6572B|nr:NUDIX hydrolase [Ruminococcus sp.]MBQ9543361.1 NUDIX hydrolase [Ruminococcus sp.]